MAKEMLINVSEGEECRIALLEDGRLEELYMERSSAASHVGNIYKGKVTNVEASIQAAFVDFGLGRNGFLHISDLLPSYFGNGNDEFQEAVGRKISRRDRPPIQRCLRRGDEIIVQIIKEGIGTKGPTLSTYLSIPGRILVMMPGMSKFGVSRKIEDEGERRRLRQILDSLKPIDDVGFIIRTAGVGKSKTEIQRDLTYLTRLWQIIQKKIEEESAPVELYTEGDLVTRTVRDIFTADVDTVVVDNKDVAKRVREVIKLTMPRTKNPVEVYEDAVPLFHKFKIEREIERMYSRHVPLPSGGSLVIDSTEAVVAIDVNSGKFREHNDAEMTAFKTDMEAADEIPRQLRLRDLGGVIICDFIDLRFDRHRRELEQRLHDNLKKDRAKSKVLRMSEFGIIEMTRQRMRPSLKRSIYSDCHHCHGSGLVKTPESMSLDVMRRLAIAMHHERAERVELRVCGEVAFYLLNNRRSALADLEAESGRKVLVRQDATLGMDEAKFDIFDSRDGLVHVADLNVGPQESIVDTAGRAQQQRSDRKPGARGEPRGTQTGRRDGRDSNSRSRESREAREVRHREEAFDAERDDITTPDAVAEAVEEREEDRLQSLPERPGTEPGAVLKAREARDPDAPEDAVENDDREDIESETAADEVEEDSQVIDLDDGHEPMGEGPRAIDAYDDDRRGRNRQPSRDRNNGGRDARENRNPNMNRPPGPGGDSRDNRDRPKDDARRDARDGRGNREPQRPNGPRDDRGNSNNREPNNRDPRDRNSRDRDSRGRDNRRDVSPRAGDRPRNDQRPPVPAGIPRDDQPNVSGERPAGADRGAPPPLGPDGQPLRKRRRRGGRRHRRRREREAAMRAALGLAPHEPLPQNARELYEKVRIEQGLPGGSLADSVDDDDDDDDDDLDESASSDTAGVTAVTSDHRTDRDFSPQENAPESETPVDGDDRDFERPSPVAVEPADESDDEPAEEPEAPASRRRPPTRRKTAKKPAAKDSSTRSRPAVPIGEKPKRGRKAAALKKPSRKAPAKGAASASNTLSPTGSSDKHLMHDTPVEPDPVSRPRSYRDLDAIPDDFD